MTRLLVVSDTHGRLERVPAMQARAGKIDALLHLGDYGGDGERIASLFGAPYLAVRGNCDFFSDLPVSRIATYENASLLLTHGDAYVTDTQMVREAEDARCKAVLFGHSHMPKLTASGHILLINPGSLSLPRGGYPPSFCVLTIDGETIRPEMISL